MNPPVFCSDLAVSTHERLRVLDDLAHKVGSRERWRLVARHRHLRQRVREARREQRHLGAQLGLDRRKRVGCPAPAPPRAPPQPPLARALPPCATVAPSPCFALTHVQDSALSS